MTFLKSTFSWIAAVALLSSCGLEPPKLKEKEVEKPPQSVTTEEKPKKPKSIPRVLTDKKGREIDATIIGHEPGYVTIIRSLDNQRFKLPVSSLSDDDQFYVRALPMFDPPPAFDEPEPEPEEKEHSIAAFQQRRIDAIEDEIGQLKDQMDNLQRNSMKWRSINSEIKRLEAEKQKLLSELNE